MQIRVDSYRRLHPPYRMYVMNVHERLYFMYAGHTYLSCKLIVHKSPGQQITEYPYDSTDRNL